MDNFSLTRNELKGLLALAALLPVICFVVGFYTAFATQLDPEPITTAPQTAAIANPQNTAPQQQQPSKPQPVKHATRPEPVVTPPVDRPFLVQAGLFSSHANALAFQKELTRQGLDAQILNTQRHNAPLYRIVLHRAETKAEARRYIATIQQQHQLEVFLTKLESKPTTGPLATL